MINDVELKVNFVIVYLTISWVALVVLHQTLVGLSAFLRNIFIPISIINKHTFNKKLKIIFTPLKTL